MKKRSNDTLKLQKKAKRGTLENLQSLVDTSVLNVHQQKAELDDIERTFLRNLMVEDRTRYCYFVNVLRPVVKEEYELMYEIGHLQEAMQTVDHVTKDPANLPQSSEELIADAKPSYNFNLDSPTHSTSLLGLNTIGSRKSSICSISSINSYGSHDSAPGVQSKISSTPMSYYEAPQPISQNSNKPKVLSNNDRPHTISAVYEKGHQRLSLTPQTFNSPVPKFETVQIQNSPKKPPLPIRCSSLERQSLTDSFAEISTTSSPSNENGKNYYKSSFIFIHIFFIIEAQPTYANIAESLYNHAVGSMNDGNNTQFDQPDSAPSRLTSPPQFSSSIKTSESSSFSENVRNEDSENDYLVDHQSPIIDVKSIGSVLDRASMFEKKLEKQKPSLLASHPIANHISASHALNLSRETVARLESIYGRRTEEVINNRQSIDKSAEAGGKKLYFNKVFP